MEVDKAFLQNFVDVLDSLITMTRDKLTFQKLLIPLLGDDWKQKFEDARSDPRFLGEWELQLADIQKKRDWAVAALDRLQKGDSILPPIERIN